MVHTPPLFALLHLNCCYESLENEPNPHSSTFNFKYPTQVPFFLNRYLAVCHPFFVHQEHAFSPSGSNFKKRALRYLLPAVAFAVVINIPKFFEFRNFIR